ncbi:hypothetical protein EBB59_10065 [Lysobacter pythonis]|uniref:Uncharacterized protein n=1 Tax=Solilutibacter pythonis TaxID=2483112 RepID=A0A3M2HM31_9GAMM|nr:DUF6587 family protein [Lysobacter pythonis]RMH90781.1 hypothetical protein EBB59_10065 [Lysobacter pythonis]
MSLALQYAVIGVVVLLAALFVWRTRFPRSWRATRIALALALLREGRPGWMGKLGRMMAPASVSKSDKCGGCDGCG